MHSNPEPKENRKRRTVGSVIFVAVLAVGAAFILSGAWIDTLNQRWVACEVTTAQATQGTHGSGTPWLVEIQTADCGTISYLEPFTEEKAQAFVSELRTGSDYEFKLGVLSRVMLKSPIKVIAPTAKDVRGVDASAG